MQCATSSTKQRSYTGDYKAAGKESEAKIIPFLSWFFPNAKIEDVRENREFQFCDVDFVAQMLDGRKLLVEIKSDKYLGKTGNFLVEAFRRYSSGDGILGWLYRSRADYIFFWASSIEKIYVLKMERIKAYIANKRNLKIQEVNTDNQTITHVFLLPESELIEKGIIKTWNFNTNKKKLQS